MATRDLGYLDCTVSGPFHLVRILDCLHFPGIGALPLRTVAARAADSAGHSAVAGAAGLPPTAQRPGLSTSAPVRMHHSVKRVSWHNTTIAVLMLADLTGSQQSAVAGPKGHSAAKPEINILAQDDSRHDVIMQVGYRWALSAFHRGEPRHWRPPHWS